MSRISCPFCGGGLRESLCLAHEVPVLHCCEKHLRNTYPSGYGYGGGLDPQTIAELSGLDNFALGGFEGVKLMATKGQVEIYELEDRDAYDVEREPLSSILKYNPVIISSYQASLKMRKALDSHKPVLAGSNSKIVISINGEKKLNMGSNYAVDPQKVDLGSEGETLHHLRRVIGVVGSKCDIAHLVVLIFNLKFRSIAKQLARSLAYDLRKRKLSLVFLSRGGE
tara:strand:- start:139 stop:813 length:675 start_codon:yes stop_codon:yes gene_type:complete